MLAAGASPLVAGVRLKHRTRRLEDQGPNSNLPRALLAVGMPAMGGSSPPVEASEQMSLSRT
jgi:hypothetical protein